METIVYATVINANRPGLWPCHERYADKQATPKPRYNRHGEVPNEKTKVDSNYPENYEMIQGRPGQVVTEGLQTKLLMQIILQEDSMFINTF